MLDNTPVKTGRKQAGQWAKGSSGNPHGRPRGSRDTDTIRAREAIGFFIEGNIDRLNSWLDQIAETDPKGAFQCFMSVVEFQIPKIARTELAGDKTAPMNIVVSWKK